MEFFKDLFVEFVLYFMSKKDKKHRPEWALHPETKNSIIGIAILTIMAITLLSFGGFAGSVGYYWNQILEKGFGFGKWIFPTALILSALGFIRSYKPNIYKAAILGGIIFLISLLGILQLNNGSSAGIGTGGYIGYAIAMPFEKSLGFWASIIIFISLFFASIFTIFNISLKQIYRFLLRLIKKEENPNEQIFAEDLFKNEGNAKFKMKKLDNEKEEYDEKEKIEELNIKTQKKEEPSIQINKNLQAHYQLPPLALLEEDKGESYGGDIKANANIIKRTLANFNINVEMAEINVGPTVTQYTFRPATGVKLSKITALQNDLSLALAAHPIRIEAPIPGRSLVGIEVPNRKTSLVRLRNLVEEMYQMNFNHQLNLAVGRDAAGNSVFASLEKMPHLLIAGATGTGKSICIHTIISSLVYQYSPINLRFILIDPKRVELAVYNDLPHLLTPVIIDHDKAINVFRWAVSEMERRYRVLSESKSRDINSYNAGSKENIMPFIVLIVDELADLMAAYGKEIEGAIVRLAQMARATGIHLIISTQRPSVEVITGLIKANITSRVAFQVASQVDSRTILDMSGSEKLLGNGDMLFLAGDISKPKRIQAPYINDKEVKKIIDFFKQNYNEPDYEEGITNPQNKSISESSFNDYDADDPLYEEAREVVINAGKASSSLLQRRLRIGYARAARLLDIMESKGLVGPADGAKPRDIYINKREEEYNENNTENF